MSKWRYPNTDTIVWVFYSKRGKPFIYAIEGMVSKFDELCKEVADYKENAMDYFEQGNGHYMFKAIWNEDGEHSFWELDDLAFMSIEEVPMVVNDRNVSGNAAKKGV